MSQLFESRDPLNKHNNCPRLLRRALLRSSAICAIAMSASLIASPSFAQSSQSSVETDSEIEDVIIVTTQRRAQNLQDVPISLDVLGTIELENRNIQGFADYAAALPSLTYSSGGPGLNSLFFRGWERAERHLKQRPVRAFRSTSTISLFHLTDLI